MKKRIFLLLILLILTTGCTCEYNLIIDGNTYKEDITILGDTNEEVTNFNRKWNIPIDKSQYNLGTDRDSDGASNNTEVYKYELSGSRLKLSYDFNQNSYRNSSAISDCLKTVNITDYEGQTIIATSSKFTCFDKYPDLNSLTINVQINGEVTKNNADRMSGKIYTWYVNRDNYSNKSISVIFKSTSASSSSGSSQESVKPQPKKTDYTMYIIMAIILIVILIGYSIFNKIKNKTNDI